MRVGLLLDASLDAPDGVQQYVLTLGRWLSEQGHEVHYLVGETTRRDIPNVHSLTKNVRVRFNGNVVSTPRPASRRRLRQLLARLQLDVLHVQTPYSPLLAGRCIRLVSPKCAVVGTFHILPYSRVSHLANAALGKINTATAHRFDAMMAVSPPAQECAGRLYGFTSVIVANPFAHDVFSQARCGKKAAHNRLKIVFLGRLVPRKGPLELLRAVVVLREQGEPLPDFTVVLAGRGKLHSECERFVQEAGLTDVVSLPGFVAEADKAKLLESADLAVFPSTRGESFGISLLEAMAAARGVVLGGNNPGYASVMPWQNQLFRPGDTAAFAKCLAYWLTHADARAAAAKRQQAHARQYDIDTIGPNIINLYTQSSKKRGF